MAEPALRATAPGRATGAAWRGASPVRVPVLVAAGAAAGCLYLQWQDPSRSGAVLPQCPTKLLTGLDCPLCGSLRCVHALTGGQWSAAVHDNLLFVVALPALLVLWVGWLAGAAGVRVPWPTLSPGARRAMTYGVVVVAVVWTVVRNLPGWPLHPLG